MSASCTSRGAPSPSTTRRRGTRARVAVDASRIVVELVPVAEVALHAVSVRSRKPPWNSYDATTTASASRSARSPSPSPCASASGLQKSACIPRKPSGEQEHRLVGRARRAHGASRARQVADEAVRSAALDAALEMRDVAGEPQELELERERERVERCASARAGRDRVHRDEEARQRLERALVPLLLDEEPQHRLRPDEPDREAVRVFARRPVRVDERDAGDRVQLAGALVEEQLDVRERLEPRAEARLRLADALRHRAHAAAVERVQVEDAIGLAVAERPEHDGLRLVGPPHPLKSRRGGVDSSSPTTCKATLTARRRFGYPRPHDNPSPRDPARSVAVGGVVAALRTCRRDEHLEPRAPASPTQRANSRPRRPTSWSTRRSCTDSRGSSRPGRPLLRAREGRRLRLREAVADRRSAVTPILARSKTLWIEATRTTSGSKASSRARPRSRSTT